MLSLAMLSFCRGILQISVDSGFQRNTHFLPPDKVKLSLNFMLKSNGHDVMV